jgi:hypothetical protein
MATKQEPRASQELHDALTMVLVEHGFDNVLTDLAQRMDECRKGVQGLYPRSADDFAKGAAYLRRARNVMFGRPKS